MPSAYCSKCGAWIWGGPCVWWICYCKADPVPFNTADGEYIGCLTRKAFDKHAWQLDKKVYCKDGKKI